MLQQTFLALIENYSNYHSLAKELWNEIEKNYSKKKRYYHSLEHLANLLKELKEVKPQIKHWNTVLFSLFYHDVVYNALKKDNEERSAELAEKRMQSIGVPSEIIENCKVQILATKQHLPNADMDTNYFTDADLSILGQSWEVYSTYYKNVRKEYSMYPDLIYNPGRKKVLQHFLAMERIFKTEYFFDKLEAQAKQNLEKEIDLL